MAEQRDWDSSIPNDWADPKTEAGRRYKKGVKVASALHFMAEALDDDPEVASRLRKQIDSVLTPEILNGESYSARGDADDVPPGYARAGDGSVFKVPTEAELESMAFSSGLEARYYPTGEKARDQRNQEIERRGNLPKFGSAALEPAYEWPGDHADEDDTAESAKRAAEQSALENDLHSIHSRENS